jgi:hypothetical protein
MRFCPHCCFKDEIDNARFAIQDAAKQTTSSLLRLLHEGNAGRIDFCFDEPALRRRADCTATMHGDVVN